MSKISNRPLITVHVSKEMKIRMAQFPEANWSAIARETFEKYLAKMEAANPNKPKVEVTGWLSKNPIKDGSGIYRFEGRDYNIIVRREIGIKTLHAFYEGKEVAEAYRFYGLIAKLKALNKR